MEPLISDLLLIHGPDILRWLDSFISPQEDLEEVIPCCLCHYRPAEVLLDCCETPMCPICLGGRILLVTDVAGRGHKTNVLGAEDVFLVWGPVP